MNWQKEYIHNNGEKRLTNLSIPLNHDVDSSLTMELCFRIWNFKVTHVFVT